MELQNEIIILFSAGILLLIGSLSFWNVNAIKNQSKKRNRILILIRLTLFIAGLAVMTLSYLNRKWTTHGLVQPNEAAWPLLAVLLPMIIAISYFTSKKPRVHQSYPHLKYEQWNLGLLIMNIATWIAYMVAYEYLLRGLLFFETLTAYGLTIAIVVNIFIYFLVHLPKGWLESLGSIPVGLILCYLTYTTGSIIPAILAHLTMAVSNDVFCLLQNPQTRESLITKKIPLK